MSPLAVPRAPRSTSGAAYLHRATLSFSLAPLRVVSRIILSHSPHRHTKRRNGKREGALGRQGRAATDERNVERERTRGADKDEQERTSQGSTEKGWNERKGSHRGVQPRVVPEAPLRPKSLSLATSPDSRMFSVLMSRWAPTGDACR